MAKDGSLDIYSFAILEDGSYELQVFERRSTEEGMALGFDRIVPTIESVLTDHDVPSTSPLTVEDVQRCLDAPDDVSSDPDTPTRTRFRRGTLVVLAGADGMVLRVSRRGR